MHLSYSMLDHDRIREEATHRPQPLAVTKPHRSPELFTPGCSVVVEVVVVGGAGSRADGGRSEIDAEAGVYISHPPQHTHTLTALTRTTRRRSSKGFVATCLGLLRAPLNDVVIYCPQEWIPYHSKK